MGGNGFPGHTTGTLIKFEPVKSTDMIVHNGVELIIDTKMNVISCMKEYLGKSFEELRYEDYIANRKGNYLILFILLNTYLRILSLFPILYL